VFTDGTAATPTYTAISNELHEGQGRVNRVYQSDYYPLNSSSTTTSGAISASDSTITVVSTNGFPSSGTIAIETNKITYTGKSSTTFTGCTNTLAHDDAQTCTAYVIERSLDDEGNVPTWVVLEPDTGHSIDFNAGEIKLVNTSVSGTIVLDNFHPAEDVYDRVRLSYQHGHDTIPKEIEKLVHYIAGKELFSGQVLNALSRGVDGFDSEGIDVIDPQIEKIINKYKTSMIKAIK